MKKLKKKWWVVIAVVAILAIAGVVAFFLLRDKEDGSKKKEKKEKLALEELTYEKLANEAYEYYLTEETDTDGDGLPDIAELEEYGTEPFACDTDGDGLDDSSEINEYSTEPNNADTDGDGLLDGVEILAGLDPLKEKTDAQTRDNDVAFERNYEAEGLTMVIKGDASVCDVYVDKFTQGNGGNTKALISPIYEFYKKGNFEEATITVQYEDAWIPEGGSEETLSICQFTDEEEWVKVDSVVDAEKNTVTATLEHFSKYGLLDISLLGQQKTVNVMLVIDDSGSMYPEEMCEGSMESDVEFKRLDMVNSFVKDLDDAARVGAAYFTGDYVKCCEMGSTDEQIAEAMEAIKTSTSHNFNGTAILKSLDAALEEFSYGSTEANFIIILTDGESTEGGINSLFATYSRDSVISEAKRKNVKIITVGLGAGVKADYLRDFSDNTDGMYIYANNANALNMMNKKLQDVVKDTYIDNDGDGVIDEVLMADSGFDMTTEALSFANPILKTEDKFQCGICGGIAIFTQLNHTGKIPSRLSDFGFTDYDLWGLRAYKKITNTDGSADDIAFTKVKGYDEEDLKALGFEIKNGIVVMDNVRDMLRSETTDAMMEIREMTDSEKYNYNKGTLEFMQKILDDYDEFSMIKPHVFSGKGKYNGVEYSAYESMVYDYTTEVDEKTAQIFAFLARFHVEQYRKEAYVQYDPNKDFAKIIDLIKSGAALYIDIPGHAINAVKITRDFDNTSLYYLYAYDNNYTDKLQKYVLERTSDGTVKVTSPSGELTTMYFRDYEKTTHLLCDGSHEYEPATCISPARCRKCGEFSGESVPHILINLNSRCECTQCDFFAEHVYGPATCESPAECQGCGAISGSNLGHDMSEPTCQTYAECMREGCIHVGTILGDHTYEKGICTICGDGDYPLGSEEYFVNLDKRARHTEFLMPDPETLVRLMMDDFNAADDPKFISDEYMNSFLSLFNSSVAQMYSTDIEAALSVVEGMAPDVLEVLMNAGINPATGIHIEVPELPRILDKSNMTAEIHYFRNKLNKAPESLEKMMEEAEDWELLSIGESQYHMLGTDGYYNLKFVSKCQKFEAVYNKDGILLTENNDPINMGTYNYQGFKFDISFIRKGIQHFMLDMAPYYRYGNTSPTDLNQGEPIYDATAEQYRKEIEAVLDSNMSPSERVSEYRKIKEKYCK